MAAIGTCTVCGEETQPVMKCRCPFRFANSFRKKPVVVQAMLFKTNNESDDENMNRICIWINQGKDPAERHAWHNGTSVFIQTLEGVMRADCGDYIIKGVEGEFYPCKPDIFEKTYEAI